jgi:hypothetical protein
MKTIGDRNNMLIGRVIDLMNELSFCLWCSVRISGLPVFLRSRAALFFKILKWYVSRNSSRDKHVTAPTAMAIILMVQRHPVALAITLPSMGAMNGLVKGKAIAAAIALPLSSLTNKSPMILGPSVDEVMTNPFRNRKASSIEILVLKAAATEQRMNKTFPAWYIGILPYSSLKGPTRNGPNPSPNSQIDTISVE